MLLFLIVGMAAFGLLIYLVISNSSRWYLYEVIHIENANDKIENYIPRFLLMYEITLFPFTIVYLLIVRQILVRKETERI